MTAIKHFTHITARHLVRTKLFYGENITAVRHFVTMLRHNIFHWRSKIPFFAAATYTIHIYIEHRIAVRTLLAWAFNVFNCKSKSSPLCHAKEARKSPFGSPPEALTFSAMLLSIFGLGGFLSSFGFLHRLRLFHLFFGSGLDSSFTGSGFGSSFTGSDFGSSFMGSSFGSSFGGSGFGSGLEISIFTGVTGSA